MTEMKSLFLQLCAFICMVSSVSARHWFDVIDPAIYDVSDLGVINKIIEEDPHFTRTTFRPTGSPTISPSPTHYPTAPGPTYMPTTTPTLAPSTAPPTITSVPTVTNNPSGTQRPSMTRSPTITAYPTGSEPTSLPSGRFEDIQGNGGCLQDEVLYEVIMRDLWGDGWDDRNLTIERLGDSSDHIEGDNLNNIVSKTTTYTDGAGNSYTVTKYTSANVTTGINLTDPIATEGLSPNPVYNTFLPGGANVGFAYVCLRPKRCYEASIPGGLWSEEIQWEVRRVAMGGFDTTSPPPLVGGGAPSNCTFYVPMNDADVGDSTCKETCSISARSSLLNSPASTLFSNVSVLVASNVSAPVTDDVTFFTANVTIARGNITSVASNTVVASNSSASASVPYQFVSSPHASPAGSPISHNNEPTLWPTIPSLAGSTSYFKSSGILQDRNSQNSFSTSDKISGKAATDSSSTIPYVAQGGSISKKEDPDEGQDTHRGGQYV